MEPEGSLPHSQQPATCPYSEPHCSGPHPPSRILNIHFHTVVPSTSGSSKLSSTLRFPHQNPVCTSPLPNTCYMPCLSKSAWFNHPNNISFQRLERCNTYVKVTRCQEFVSFPCTLFIQRIPRSDKYLARWNACGSSCEVVKTALSKWKLKRIHNFHKIPRHQIY
jgi:hypothetical protein